MENQNQTATTTVIQTVDEFVNYIVKKEKFKSSIAYVAGAIDSLNSVSSIYYNSMNKSEIIRDLKRCIERKGLMNAHDRIKNFATGKYKSIVII